MSIAKTTKPLIEHGVLCEFKKFPNYVLYFHFFLFFLNKNKTKYREMEGLPYQFKIFHKKISRENTTCHMFIK